MSLVSQLHSSRQLNLPVMQWVVALFGEFHSFPSPSVVQLLSVVLRVLLCLL